MSKVYKGSQSNIQFLPIIMIIIIGGILLYAAGISSFPSNIGMGIIILFAIIIVILSFITTQKGFYAEIKDDGSLRIVAAQGITDEPEKDSIKFYGAVKGIFAKLNASKDNIISVDVASKNEIQKFLKHSTEEMIIVQNPIKRFKIGMQLLKDAFQKELEPGIGVYSYVFVSNIKDMVEIRFRRLSVKSDFNEFLVENPIVFVSIKDSRGFIGEF